MSKRFVITVEPNDPHENNIAVETRLAFLVTSLLPMARLKAVEVSPRLPDEDLQELGQEVATA